VDWEEIKRVEQKSGRGEKVKNRYGKRGDMRTQTRKDTGLWDGG